MDDYKNRVEAVLFITGRFMTLDELRELTGIASVGILKESLAQLKKEYEDKEGALAIYEDNGKYQLNIKKDYNYLTPKLLSNTEFDRPTQETLAVIAYKQPVFQSDIVKMRGNKAYDHIKILREAGFITSEKHGRTRVLKLTPKFFDYFDIVESHLKSKFNEVEEKVGYVEELSEEDVQKKIQEIEHDAESEEEQGNCSKPDKDTGNEAGAEAGADDNSQGTDFDSGKTMKH